MLGCTIPGAPWLTMPGNENSKNVNGASENFLSNPLQRSFNLFVTFSMGKRVINAIYIEISGSVIIT